MDLPNMSNVGDVAAKLFHVTSRENKWGPNKIDEKKRYLVASIGIGVLTLGLFHAAYFSGKAIYQSLHKEENDRSHVMLDSDHRKSVVNTTKGGIANMTTWSRTKSEDVHTMDPVFNLDASNYTVTRDIEGISGGIVTSADGYHRGFDSKGNIMGEGDKNIADIAHEGCSYLAKQMMKENDPDKLSSNLTKLVSQTDAHLKKYNSKTNGSGGANLAGVRMFAHAGDEQIRIVGVNVGNQRVMLTNTKTGKTEQLNNLLTLRKTSKNQLIEHIILDVKVFVQSLEKDHGQNTRHLFRLLNRSKSICNCCWSFRSLRGSD